MGQDKSRLVRWEVVVVAVLVGGSMILNAAPRSSRAGSESRSNVPQPPRELLEELGIGEPVDKGVGSRRTDQSGDNLAQHGTDGIRRSQPEAIGMIQEEMLAQRDEYSQLCEQLERDGVRWYHGDSSEIEEHRLLAIRLWSACERSRKSLEILPDRVLNALVEGGASDDEADSARRVSLHDRTRLTNIEIIKWMQVIAKGNELCATILNRNSGRYVIDSVSGAPMFANAEARDQWEFAISGMSRASAEIERLNSLQQASR